MGNRRQMKAQKSMTQNNITLFRTPSMSMAILLLVQGPKKKYYKNITKSNDSNSQNIFITK